MGPAGNTGQTGTSMVLPAGEREKGSPAWLSVASWPASGYG